VLSCVMIVGLLSSITFAEWRVLIVALAAASLLFVATRRRRAALATSTS
jgi:hypothetical protein